MEQLGLYGTTPIFATQENFDAYKVSALLAQRREELRTQ